MHAALSMIAGRYLLKQQIGAGGMGRVWLARDQILLRDVAVKELVPPTYLTAEQIDRVRAMMVREAQAAAQVCHPNVVRVYDILDTPQGPWIVMEYVPSQTLHQLIKSNGPLAPACVATIGLALLDALTAAHRAGVLHRDVTPQNTLLARDGRIVLADFGVALLNNADITELDLVGTPHYMAPERVAHGVCGPEGDLWSLGATLYAAVEGRAPYARSSVMATLSALLTLPPDATKHADALAPILGGMLAREPADRWGPSRILAELRRLLDRGTGEARSARADALERRPGAQAFAPAAG